MPAVKGLCPMRRLGRALRDEAVDRLEVLGRAGLVHPFVPAVDWWLRV